MSANTRRTMGRATIVALLIGATFTSGAAQTPTSPSLPKSQVPTLGRPTKPDDPAPILDFWNYFQGTWNVTWEYPESPLGPADVLSGKTAYTQKSETTFEALTEGETTSGPVTVREVFEYIKDARTLTRTVTDSRGFGYTQHGTVNGDLGGQFTLRLDGAPFVYKGQSLRINSVVRLLSPFNYRTQFHFAIGDGPPVNFGNPWWRKETTR